LPQDLVFLATVFATLWSRVSAVYIALDGAAQALQTGVVKVTGPLRLCISQASTVALNSCGYFHFPQRPHSFWRKPALCCVSAHSCQAK
jgi:hypothetical protein